MDQAYDLAGRLVAKDGGFKTRGVLEAIAGSETDRVAFDALCFLGAGSVRRPDLNPDLPDAFREFLVDVLSGRRRRPAKRRGLPSPDPYRDELVFEFLDDMVEAFGVAPTRGEDAEHRDSACDLAAEALRGAGLRPKSHDVCKNIWERYNSALVAAQRGERDAYPPHA